MTYQGESKVDGSIIRGTLMIEGLDMWIDDGKGGRTAVWPDTVKEEIE